MRPSYVSMHSGSFPHIVEWMAKRMGKTRLDYGNHNVLWFADHIGTKVAFVYNLYQTPNIFIHVAAREGVLWAKRDILFHVFNYPFGQLGCLRVTTTAPSEDKRHIRLLEHGGFKQEGTLRNAERKGVDTLIFGMLREECRWLDYQERKVA